MEQGPLLQAPALAAAAAGVAAAAAGVQVLQQQLTGGWDGRWLLLACQLCESRRCSARLHAAALAVGLAGLLQLQQWKVGSKLNVKKLLAVDNNDNSAFPISL
jgi:hypothetical protein